MDEWEARVVVKHLADEEEREVGSLLLDMGLELVAVHSPVSLSDERNNREGEVDLLLRLGDTAVIAEVSVQKSRGSKVDHFFSVFGTKDVLDELKRKHVKIRDARNFRRIYFDMHHSYNMKEFDDIKEQLKLEGNFMVLKDEFGAIKEWVGERKRTQTQQLFDVMVSRNGNEAISCPKA